MKFIINFIYDLSATGATRSTTAGTRSPTVATRSPTAATRSATEGTHSGQRRARPGLALVVACAGLSLLSPSTARAEADDLQRLAALVDYVAADYAGAVRDGQVLAATEYEEQRGLVRDALALVAALPAARDPQARARVAEDLARLSRAVEAKANPPEVVAACRAVRERLLTDFGLVLVPASPPSRARARELYASACAACHGADGRATTEKAAQLNPHPVSFFDGERMERISPQLAYHALTFGVKETAMASFDTVSAADRWSLAFHVVALRHDAAQAGDTGHGGHAAYEDAPAVGSAGPVGTVGGAVAIDAAAGERAFRAARPSLSPTATRLASLSDGELSALLVPAIPDDKARAQALAWLRTDATFAADPGGTFDLARRRLAEIAPALRAAPTGATARGPADRAAGAEAIAATEAASRKRAHDLAVGAYLEGIEPHEAALRAHDPVLTDAIEAAFLELRRAVDTGEPVAEVARLASAATLLLDRADEKPMSAGVAFLAAFGIAAREGFEAALLIAALLAFLRKSGREDAARLVHGGWLLAIPAGAATWFLTGALVGGAHRELVEAGMTLLAAAMLIGMTHWFFGKLEAQHWVGFLRRKVGDLSSGRHDASLFGLAFFAAFREAFEVVLFYRALLLDAHDERGAVAAGAVVGGVSIFGAVLVLGRVGRKLNPRPVMLASSVLLAALSLALVGRAVHALQEGGYLALTPVRIPDLSSVGIYANAQSLMAQGVVLVLLLAPSLRRLRGRPIAAAPAPAPIEAPRETRPSQS